MNRRLQFGVVALSAGLGFTATAQPAPDQVVRQAMQQGAAAMNSGQFDRAVEAYSNVTHLQPAFAEGFLNLGLAEERGGHLEEAKTALEKAIHLKSSIRGAHLFLGTIAYKQDRYKEAEEDFLAETVIDPRAAKAFMWLGVSRLAEERPEAAVAPLDKAHELDPKDVDTLYHRGRAHLLVANGSYAAMYELDQDSMRVHQVLAEAYAQAYRTPDAISEFELATKMAPRQPGIHEELGDQDWVAGKLEDAAGAYREELKIDPNTVSARYKLGSLMVLTQHAEEGVELLQGVLRADPSLTDAHYYLANGLMAVDRNEEAIHEFELAIAAAPGNDRAMSAYYKLAGIYRNLHRTAEAQAATQNFLRMRAEASSREDKKAAQRVRKRTELPVEDAENPSTQAEH